MTEVDKREKFTKEELMFLKALHSSGAFRRKDKRDDENGFLYLVKDNASNRIKIGITTNHKERLRSLNTIVPYGITIISIFSSNRYKELERDVHERYKNKRRNGEWFEFNEVDLKECMEYIEKTTYDDVRSLGV